MVRYVKASSEYAEFDIIPGNPVTFNGKPMIFKHGTDSKFDRFSTDFISCDNKLGFGFYFTLGNLKFEYEHTIEAYLIIENPIMDSDRNTIPKENWRKFLAALGVESDFQLSDYELDNYVRVCDWYDNELPKSRFFSAVKKYLGIDGIISVDRNSAVVFDDSQIIRI